MFPFGFCPPNNASAEDYWRGHQARKLRLMTSWRDGLERQLAGLNAAISTLEEQMRRQPPGAGTPPSSAVWTETQDGAL